MRTRRGDRGSALLLVVVVVILVVAIAGAYLALTGASSSMTAREALGLHALYCAETGAALTISQINAGTLVISGTIGGDGDGLLSPTDDPALAGQLSGNFGSGAYDVTVALWGYDGLDNDKKNGADDGGERNYMTITSRGDVGGEVRVVECILGRTGGGVFWNAVYAGNSSQTAYTVDFKGVGSPNPNLDKADNIQGDVYIDGNINVSQDAKLNGKVMVTGNVTGWSNWEIGEQPLFDINKRNYPVNNDVNVLGKLQNPMGASYGPGVPQGGGTPVGGNAWQLPASDPGHIFRLNPSDRTGVYSGYNNVVALEDPWEKLQNDANWNGSDATKISYTKGYEYGKTYYIGPQKSGDKVAMIIDNTSTYSYKFLTPGAEMSGQQTLIVVKGDMYIGDNIFHNNSQKDAVVFIALKNDDGTGGNIYFGDQRYGTVEQFNAYMFAENDFVTTNLFTGNSKAADSKILVNGNMAAGNQVDMNLDATDGTHHKWQVVFDDRLKKTLEGTANGASSLDGIASLVPPNPTVNASDYSILSWRQLSPKAQPAQKGPQF